MVYWSNNTPLATYLLLSMSVGRVAAHLSSLSTLLYCTGGVRCTQVWSGAGGVWQGTV